MLGRILICGDRNWTDVQSIREVILKCRAKYGDFAVIHGAARGADEMAGEAAILYDLTVWSEPAKWDEYGKSAGPIRNRLMLDRYKPHLVIAFHGDLENSKGTLHMVTIARKAGFPVIVITNRKDAEEIDNVLPNLSVKEGKSP